MQNDKVRKRHINNELLMWKLLVRGLSASEICIEEKIKKSDHVIYENRKTKR